MDSGPAKAVGSLIKRNDCMLDTAATMRRWCTERFTTDRWLDENEREWYALDRVCRSRPWATNRDTAFKYPFREATRVMRQVEGKWIGDERPTPKDTRGKAPSEVLTQIHATPIFPSEHRVVLFAPEFGGDKSFDVETWSYLEPEDQVDIWVVCWQGWADFSAMIEQVAYHVASFADGINTVWFGQGMGGIVAYEVLKYMERFDLKNPNLPVALVVSDCPAPHLFAQLYKPYSVDDWPQTLSKYSSDDQARISAGSSLMRTYAFRHKDQAGLPIPVVALYHSGESLADVSSVRAWADYSQTEEFKLVELGDAEVGKWYLDGIGYAHTPSAEVLGVISEAYKVHDRWLKDGIFPDIGPADGPLPDQVDCVIVGAGIAGVYQAKELAKSGKSIICLDRHDKLGGVWDFFGNDGSRVNTSEIGYRILERTGRWSRPNEDHTPRRDILRDIYEIASNHCYGRIRFHTDVQRVSKCDDGTYEVYTRSVKDGTEHKIRTSAVSFHVNRRIGKRREVDWEDSKLFRGRICYGYGNETRDINFWNKSVLIVGAGAFAFENVRTAIEQGAKHVTLLGRRDGTTCPKWVDMIAFLRPLDSNLQTNKTANTISFDAWQKLYLEAGLPTPSCWADGMLKPHNHTISVSDLAFVAGYHGLCDLKVGEIRGFRSDGQGVELTNGSRIDCNVVIKCCGFHLNDEVPKVTGSSKMQPYGLIDFNLNYGAEPLLDWGQFGSSKNSDSAGSEDVIGNIVNTPQFAKGMENFRKLGLKESSMLPLGNPFGSGQGGPIDFLSRYFAWLVAHPEEQAALLEYGGPPMQEVVELWHSQIGKNSTEMMLKLVANLATVGEVEPTASTSGRGLGFPNGIKA